MANAQLSPVTDNADWVTNPLATNEAWKFILSDAEIADLSAMAINTRDLIKNDAKNLISLGKDKFELGKFTQTLNRVYDGLKSGQGVALIRGLPIDDLDPLEVATIYWAIGCHLGTATPNNPEGDMFGHITDLGKSQKDATTRGYQTRELMDYHCDQCDIVGLLCVQRAKSGGVSMVASSVSMYNELLRTHPDYAQALTEPLYWSKMGEFAPGELPYYNSPVFNFINDQLCTSFGPKHIEKGHALAEAPDLTDLQRKAIRTAEEIAHAQRFEMVLEKGDMQFANNYVTLHTRSEYQDHDDPALKRLLWRLWLMNDDLRPRTGYSKQFMGGVNLGAGHRQIRI